MMTSGGAPAIGSPRNRTAPSRGDRRPAIVLSSVDLPAPFGPMIATISPASTRRPTPRRISWSP